MAVSSGFGAGRRGARPWANSIGPLEERGNLGAELRRRSTEIVARIEQLRDRRQELADHYPRSWTADGATQAQAHAPRARQCAMQARLRAAERHHQAAEAHSRLAVWYERQGDSQRAQAHHEAASTDRARASEDLRQRRRKRGPDCGTPIQK